MISMDDSIDGYWAELIATVRRVAEARSRNVRTTNETVIRFEHTRLDRLWQLKLDKRLVDSVLVCPEDGHRELVHMDMILGLDRDMVSFYEKYPSQSDDNLNQYKVDHTISSAQLQSIVYFAYNRRCELTEQLAISLAEIADEFGIYSLLDHCMAFLCKHFHDGIAVQGLELSFYSSPELKQFFQSNVEDHFDQLWLTNQQDFMRLTYDTLAELLSSDWLNVESESTPWQVIQAWIGYDPKRRLTRLASLIKDVLRFGRIPSSFNIRQSIVSSKLFQSQPIEVCQDTSDFITQILDEANRAPKPIDGHGLPYDESAYHFRPRNPTQLLILVGRKSGETVYRSSDSIQLYDYQLNLWRSSRVTLPQKVSMFATHIIGSTMYLVGGLKQNYSGILSVFSIDLAQAEPKWIAVTPMRTIRVEAASVVYKGKLVVIGGEGPRREDLSDCEQYDPITRVWTQFARLNRAVTYDTATVHNERIYVSGGMFSDGISVEMYNPQSDHWQFVAPMNFGRYKFTLVNCFDQILALGGSLTNAVESYNPNTNLWTIEILFDKNQSVSQGAQLNRELVATDKFGRLYTIPTLCPNARAVQLTSPVPDSKLSDYSLAVISSRHAVAFHKP